MDPRLARYDIVREVHRSDRATVLQAIDLDQGRPVALKIYEVDDDAELTALRAEARVLLDLAPHPALPTVRHDFDAEAQYCIVMDWVDGIDLQTVLDDDGDPGLPVPTVLDVVTRVADALDHLHRQDPPVVHADVKPANIVRRRDGTVVLVDFGMAAQADPGRVGTPGFVAPEVAAGEKPGPASDVYGLAATAVALLTGAPPSGVGVVPPGLESRLGAVWAGALRRALSVDPTRRPATGRDLVERLRMAGSGELPTGIVTFVGTQLAGSARLWEEHAEEMRGVGARLGDLVADTVERRGGSVVGAMAEGQRTISAFPRPSAAAEAARVLHDRVQAESWPTGMRIALRVAVETGEVEVDHGVYTGAVIDRVTWLRSIAPAGTTVTSAATAALLRNDLDDADLVELGSFTPPDGGRAQRLFGVGSGNVVIGPEPESRRDAEAEVEAEAVDLPEVPSELEPVPTRRILADVLQQPIPLTALTAFALAAVYLLLLAPQLGLGLPVALVALVSGATAVATTVWGTRAAIGADRARIEDERARRELAERANDEVREIDRMRRTLVAGFSEIGAQDAVQELDRLNAAYETFRASVHRAVDMPWTTSRLLPDLADETYRRGLSVLSDALELLTVSVKLRPDEDQLEKVDGFRSQGAELVAQAGRCTHALNEACMEVTVMRVQRAESSVDAVVDTMEANLERVREVQDAFRRLDPGSGRLDRRREGGSDR